MAVGADTGFFVELAKKNPKAEKIWDRVSVGEEELIVSVLTLNELLVYFYKRGKPEEAGKYTNLLKLMPNITLITVSSRIAELSAKYKFSLGIPTTDSIILTTFLLEKVDSILTTDEHFKMLGIPPVCARKPQEVSGVLKMLCIFQYDGWNPGMLKNHLVHGMANWASSPSCHPSMTGGF